VTAALGALRADRHDEATSHLAVRGLGRQVDGRPILEPVWFTADRGEVVGIAGGSGAGKSTLLDLIAGTSTADVGTLLVDGRPRDACSTTCGYVPQDDIIHGDLPLGRSLGHAAALRLSGTDAATRRRRVHVSLDTVGLDSHADVRVGSLSGGQRKRACIAAELLAEPELFLLDEPTSGLDPASAADLMDQLHSLAHRGATVVLTTHSPADLDRCDRVVLLAPGGRHVFTGSAAEMRAHFDVDDIADAYAHLDRAPSLDPPGDDAPAGRNEPVQTPPSLQRGSRSSGHPVGRDRSPAPHGFRWARQWAASTVRTAELVVRNRLALSIMLGSPVFVIGMLAALFRPGTIGSAQPAGAVHVVFWVVFSAFFFGLTYGLLQIVAEREIFRRERAAGLRVSAYLAAKVTVLGPFLAAVDLAMLAVLEQTGQLPTSSAEGMLGLGAVLVAVSTAALAVGLAASALVMTASQATLALPMLCFPQVLFAGAVVPVSEMAAVGRALSAGLVGRWGFESFGRALGLGAVDEGAWPAAGFAITFDGSAATGIVALTAITVAGLGVAGAALRRM
jgi:ABC-type multidrug transport system ATPase subunit